MIEEQDLNLNPGKIRTREEEDNEEPPDLSNTALSNKILQKPISNDQQKNNQQINFDENQLDNGNIIDMAQSQQFQYKEIDIILYDQYTGSKMVFLKKKCYINQKDEIQLKNLIDQVKLDYKTSFEGALISYFDSIQDMFVFCGQYPLDNTAIVPLDSIVGDSLEIKVRTKKKDLVSLLTEEQSQKEQKDKKEEDEKDPAAQKQRVKERKIGEVVEKVALWRRFYTGFFDENQQFKSLPLEKAAEKVGISKKTLDDYLLQIRCGKKYGFDFNENKDKRIGKLRSYVKDNKKGKDEKSRK